MRPIAVDPGLPERIVTEISTSALAEDLAPLIFVRGELGIGKSTLVALLEGELRRADGPSAPEAVRNALGTCALLEAGDLESPNDFASRVKAELSTPRPIVVLARPGTLEAAAQWIGAVPTATVTMRAFEPGGLLFSECLDRVCDSVGVDRRLRAHVVALAGQLPAFLQTPFYFQELAYVVARAGGDAPERISPLQVLERALDLRIGTGAFDALLQCAIGRRAPDDLRPIAGIIDHGGFRHDGYRNVVLAVSVISGDLRFDEMAAVPNAVPAVRVLLHHLEHVWQSRSIDSDDAVVAQLAAFVEMDDSNAVTYLVYIQGLVAGALLRLGLPWPAAQLRRRCLESVDRRTVGSAEDQWWDISDALSLVGDPRLRDAQRGLYAADGEYFTYVPATTVIIGSEHVPSRSDDAKPVAPYQRGPVSIGPLWVGNFLVTNELFADFWAAPNLQQYFRNTGASWFARDPALVAQIEEAFDVAATRCFWKEVKEQQMFRVDGRAGNELSVLEIARERATRRSRLHLWDPTQADDRFSAPGNPVVGVTWWEAMAFCAWWTDTKLVAGNFPAGSIATLLTDWEWEALRRRFYDPDVEDRATMVPARYPAHLRSPSRRDQGTGRLTSVMRPLHVGLAPVPCSPGPFDMVGNVWEWTRSRVFGRIVRSTRDEGQYGASRWEDGDLDAERTPVHPGRDAVDEADDLAYRAVRGASFFSIDPEAAWHPAYRLCDPPFSSYFDLGFRLAVYPPAR